MIILSHRGYWKTASEKNTEAAFRRSFDSGFGTETDVRDLCGHAVVSHDPPAGNEIEWGRLLELPRAKELTLAVNIKSDGLADLVGSSMKSHSIRDWFAFDMSIPDMRHWLKLGLPVFTRLSDAEPVPVFFDQCHGVWLDGFDGIWYGPALIEAILRKGKRICVVSNELHDRDPAHQWAMLRDISDSHRNSLMLCTDHPVEAKAYFRVAGQ